MLIMILAAAVVFLAKYFLDGDVVGSGISKGVTAAAVTKMDGQFDPMRLTNAFNRLLKYLPKQ
jgi:hypothetical protein